MTLVVSRSMRSLLGVAAQSVMVAVAAWSSGPILHQAYGTILLFHGRHHVSDLTVDLARAIFDLDLTVRSWSRSVDSHHYTSAAGAAIIILLESQ